MQSVHQSKASLFADTAVASPFSAIKFVGVGCDGGPSLCRWCSLVVYSVHLSKNVVLTDTTVAGLSSAVMCDSTLVMSGAVAHHSSLLSSSVSLSPPCRLPSRVSVALIVTPTTRRPLFSIAQLSPLGRLSSHDCVGVCSGGRGVCLGRDYGLPCLDDAHKWRTRCIIR